MFGEGCFFVFFEVEVDIIGESCFFVWNFVILLFICLVGVGLIDVDGWFLLGEFGLVGNFERLVWLGYMVVVRDFVGE